MGKRKSKKITVSKAEILELVEKFYACGGDDRGMRPWDFASAFASYLSALKETIPEEVELSND